MRTYRLVISVACINLIMLTSRPVSAEPQVSVFRLQALNESGVREGTCFVIHQERRADGTFLVLVTSARLFEREPRRRARVFADGDTPMEIGHEAITTPYANMRDVAVLTVTLKGPQVSALPVVFDPVPSGTEFVISGVRSDGSRALVAQRVRFRATRTVLGDRTTTELTGCQGAPAMVERGVFGIVSECGRDRVPEITPLAVSRNFLLRAVPELNQRSSRPEALESGNVFVLCAMRRPSSRAALEFT
jgi:hypothetical protein